MSEQTINCPKCGTEIPLTEALTSQIETSIRTKLETEINKKEQALLQQQKNLTQQTKELAAKEQAIDEQVAEKLKAERKKIAEQEKAKILAEQSEQTKALEQELEEKRIQLSEANKKELELRKQQQKLEEEKATIELTIQRQLDAERKKISEEIGKKAVEEQLLKMREKDDKIDSLMKQINELKRRAEQGSQEAQGEALEGALQVILQQAFPFDRFEEVKRGQRGADILQIVRNNTSKECGKILWESKYTKAFAISWIEKLKTDQQEAGTELAVLTTISMPKEIKNFGLLDGVWITDFVSAVGLATALRIGLINAAREKSLSVNRDSLKDVIFQYITGQEFAMQIRAIAEAFGRMKGDLDREKTAMEKIWKSREKQIEVVLSNVVGIRGSLEGYLGPKALPAIETLSLESVHENGKLE